MTYQILGVACDESLIWALIPPKKSAVSSLTAVVPRDSELKKVILDVASCSRAPDCAPTVITTGPSVELRTRLPDAEVHHEAVVLPDIPITTRLKIAHDVLLLEGTTAAA